jgi:hypothetical protein
MVDDISSPVYSLADFASAQGDAECKLPRCRGVLLLDASDFLIADFFDAVSPNHHSDS